ncbi:MAG TPA: DUF1835 domain-containing protein [Burkholderiales bacterium]|nr:DUF1835 domain-containing protein [Burkholderiales bacterium]
MLHITNGDAVVARMRDGALPGIYLPWRDALHEGPVPRTENLTQLSTIRARYLAEAGYGSELALRDQFKARDAQLAGAARENEIVLWFEHDLYDQLQLLQILDWLAMHAAQARVSLIVIGSYPAIARFVGLGQLTPAQLVGLLDARTPAEPAHFQAARTAWRAFRESTPRSCFALLRLDWTSLPYLPDALLRLLEELPSTRNGLSRTEQAALAVIAEGTSAPREIFSAVQALEDRPFMGDWSFWRLLSRLARPPMPLVRLERGARFFYPPRVPDGPEFAAQRLSLTERGREVLEQRIDAVRLRGIDRWLGGTHLEPHCVWRWDGEHQRLVAPEAT